MNSDPGDFDSLRKLMRLKHYEQPPPGYFRRLPDKIIFRLERGEGQPGIWEKLVMALALRPAVAYGFSLASFGALTLSLIYSVKSQPGESAQIPLNNGWRTGAGEEARFAQFDYNPSEQLHVANWMGNTDPSQAGSNLPSLFESGAHDNTVRVNFAYPP
jgi:hypothetical protein